MSGGIQAFHQGGNGWCDIGYNFLVDRFGNIYEGRGGGITKAVVGAHAAPFNTRGTGVALIGNHSATGVSSAAKTGLRNLLAWKLGYHGVNAAGYTSANGQTIRTLIAHRDVNQTECNGNVGYLIMPQLRAEVAFVIGLYNNGVALEENPNGGWYGLDGSGEVSAVFAPHYGDPDFNWNIARDIAVMPDGKGYIVLDGFGGLHKFGSAAQGTMKNLWGAVLGGLGHRA
ncbi:MAG: N-acetylmuramoyl-L-alanine amidase [Acidimicrobiia bacterium]|nr:N-acetylmuramoyl-L-alanine amidase [Acidimicrobiia bacterium]